MADFTRVQPGQKREIKAAQWNALLESADYVEQLRNSGGALTGRSSLDVCVRPILNSSGDDVDRFGILGIESTLFTPSDAPDEFTSRPAFTGDTPDIAKHLGKFAIALEPIADGEVGLAVVSGIVPGQVHADEGEEADAKITVFGIERTITVTDDWLPLGWHIKSATKVICEWDAIDRVWNAKPEEPTTTWTAATTSSVSKSSTNYLAGNLRPCFGGVMPCADSGTTTVGNPDKWEANSGTAHKVMRVSDGLDFLQGPCKGDT